MRIASLLLVLACRPTLDTGDTALLDSGDTGRSDTSGADADHDGYAAPADCDDHDPDVHPGAPEICDGKDDDCSGAPAFGEGDVNGDGQLDCVHCDAAGFWQATKELADPSALQVALDGLETGPTCDYSSATSYMFLRLDNHNGYVEGVYTGRESAVTNQKPSDMNTEHTWLQSEGADVLPAKCDLHHLYPTDINANSERGNHPFGIVVSDITWSVGGSKLGRDSSGQVVFEPRDVHKGNVARSMLYFAQRYDKRLTSAQIALFKQWRETDPVDDAEWQRAEKIAQTYSYANPFVACPDLVDRAW